ncbi:MAG TPA: GerMN domain-containing protein [Anaerolineae bacterium]
MIRSFCFFTFCTLFLLIGCSTPIPTADATPKLVIAPTQAPSQTPTAAPTDVPTPAPTSVPTIAPTATIVPQVANATPTVKPSSTRAPIPTAGTMKVKLFFVALNDNGKSGKMIGCQDSIVAVDRVIPATSAPLTAALKELFSIRDRYYGQSGLYNALSQSNIKVSGVAITNGRATINLTGSFSSAGVCDDPRLVAQIRQTALQFPTVGDVAIFINGTPIERILSGKGG